MNYVGKEFGGELQKAVYMRLRETVVAAVQCQIAHLFLGVATNWCDFTAFPGVLFSLDHRLLYRLPLGQIY